MKLTSGQVLAVLGSRWVQGFRVRVLALGFGVSGFTRVLDLTVCGFKVRLQDLRHDECGTIRLYISVGLGLTSRRRHYA